MVFNALLEPCKNEKHKSFLIENKCNWQLTPKLSAYDLIENKYVTLEPDLISYNKDYLPVSTYEGIDMTRFRPSEVGNGKNGSLALPIIQFEFTLENETFDCLYSGHIDYPTIIVNYIGPIKNIIKFDKFIGNPY